MGFATGGLWKTTNNGTTFRPVFDSYGTHSVGALAISPANPDIVWVGTGEANNRQSSSFGEGIYKSTDGGETYMHMGLRETQTIARVIAHPTNANVAWVAANGHLFGPNSERGVFKTTDGGRTWNHVLSVDENTGATDLVINPANPDLLFAATYQRRRTACCFVGGGPGSGIWRSDDGGDTWTRLSGNGLPRGTMGRVALATTPADPNVIYAQIEVAADRERPYTEEERAEIEARNDRNEPLPPDDQYNGVWRSMDGGMTWEFRSNENGRPMYFSQIRVDPNDPETVYVVDTGLHRSVNGGLTFDRLSGYGHVDQHAMWINPENSDHIILGNDGSVDISYDQGETWESLRRWSVGQPYHASVDMRRPYYVCTGLQDNGSWCGPSAVRTGSILSEDWYRVGAAATASTPRSTPPTTPSSTTNPRTATSAASAWRPAREAASVPARHRKTTRTPTSRRPRSPAPRIRWNWNTPFVLSPHNPEVIYAGGNRLFRSLNRGQTWTMSPDLTKNIDRDQETLMGMANSMSRCNRMDRGEECILSRNDGVSRWSTIVSVSESSIVPGLLWVGTDDGNIQVSRDGGATWSEVGGNIPGGTRRYYVSRVEASHHDAATAYASVDGHRNDDLRPYVYVTRDYGASWQDIASNLPEYGNVNTVRQDSGEPAPPLRRHRVRLLRLARRGGQLGALHDRAAGGAGGRRSGAPQGRGPRARHARPQRPGRRRHQPPAAVHRGGRRRGRVPFRAPRRRALEARRAALPVGDGQQGAAGRQRPARNSHPLLPRGRRFRSGAVDHRRNDRRGLPRPGRFHAGGNPPRPVESPGEPAGAAGRRWVRRRRWRFPGPRTGSDGLRGNLPRNTFG